MTLTVKLDLDTVSVNDDATYLGQRLFLSKVVVGHTHTIRSSLSGPLKWSVNISLVSLASTARMTATASHCLILHVGLSGAKRPP